MHSGFVKVVFGKTPEVAFAAKSRREEAEVRALVVVVVVVVVVGVEEGKLRSGVGQQLLPPPLLPPHPAVISLRQGDCIFCFGVIFSVFKILCFSLFFG